MAEIMRIKKVLARGLLLLAFCLCLAGAPSMAADASEGADTSATQQIIVPLSDNEEGGAAFVLILLVVGPVFYGITMARYSGSSKRHEHERQTQSMIDELEKEDVFLRHVTGASSKTIGSYKNSNQI
jgi:hypothetical protein